MTTHIRLQTLTCLSFATVLFASSFTQAETVMLSAELAGADSDGTGMVSATYDTDTMMMTWTVEYENLSGPPGAMHLHGPTEPGGNAGVALPLSGDMASPIQGSATLNAE